MCLPITLSANRRATGVLKGAIEEWHSCINVGAVEAALTPTAGAVLTTAAAASLKPKAGAVLPKAFAAPTPNAELVEQ